MDRSPVPLSSNTRSCTPGSRAAASSTTRMANVLPIRGLAPISTRLEHQQQEHRVGRAGRRRTGSAGTGPRGPPFASGHGLRLGLRHVLVADPQHQPAGVRLAGGFGPHAPERAAQPGGEPVAALDDVRRRSPRTGGRRRRASPGPSRVIGAGNVTPGPPLPRALFISARPSAPSARITTSEVSALHLGADHRPAR